MKKKLIITVISLSLLLLAASIFCVWKINQTTTLKKLSFTFEYGKSVEITKNQLFNKKDLNSLQEIKIDVSSIKNEKNKTYPQVGEYDCTVRFKTFFTPQTKTFKVCVKDTVEPKFSKFTETIEIPAGTETNYDFTQYFKAEDLSGADIQIDLKSVDFNTPGDYTILVRAIDSHDNTVEKECTVKVTDIPSSPSVLQESKEDGLFYSQGILIVNKKHGLPSNYAPGENAEAGNQIRKLIADMQAQGYHISNQYSGYRSYSYQASLYNGYVASYGQAQADRFSAKPGFSEHQTGLAFDLKHTNGTLVETQPEVQWIKAHAHEYGFIVRYPQGKENITGYMAEPWHLRYVGDIARTIYESGLTLEEFLNVPGGTSY